MQRGGYALDIKKHGSRTSQQKRMLPWTPKNSRRRHDQANESYEMGQNHTLEWTSASSKWPSRRWWT